MPQTDPILQYFTPEDTSWHPSVTKNELGRVFVRLSQDRQDCTKYTQGTLHSRTGDLRNYTVTRYLNIRQCAMSKVAPGEVKVAAVWSPGHGARFAAALE